MSIKTTLGQKASLPAKEKRTTDNNQTVRFNLYLPKEAYEALERLQQLTGKKSMAETIRAALKLYGVVQEGIDEGKEIMMIDKQTKERERIHIVS